MTRTIKFLFAIGVLFSAACNSQKEVAETPFIPETPEVFTEAEEPIPSYKPSRERLFNLVHTSLDVSFDMKNQRMNGKAELALHPYFYPQTQLVLDAQGFDLNAVGLVFNGLKTELKYDYDNQQILIHLDQEYSMKDTVKIFVDYVAKPEELKTEKGTAITDAKGLYFIDPLDEDPAKPTQIWTQGETQASSAWFPTIDAPNESTTQDISITVEDRFTTLSNGIKVSSTKNEDGTRTDKWVQSDPHAPYLVMMAVGEFAEVKDSWNGLDVNYYVEPRYEEHADDIFGNTPEMMQYYSDLLNYPYPWEKYSQIVVRDYVSGAMENTSAVIHGEFLQQTERELLDHNNEDVIAHELFHHWFGDLVTCESWANLPINESFATYGENLWREHKYGRFSSDDHGNAQLRTYLMESKRKQVNMIRFHYEEKDDMFDAHSYHKGGRILHMLRIHLGDDAFFKSLELYLKENAHRAVEMHDFRLACEKVSG
ncbi:MAG: aminopeptidase N, partial [Flavobacteriales bacterium]